MIEILVVDVNPGDALVIRDYLKDRYDVRITVAHGGEEAIDFLSQPDHRTDLILLDLSLPTLNGMEAARRIRKVCPNSKILFLSQDSSAEIVEEALRVGAHGYLLKSEATELPLAVDAIAQGTWFVSRRLKRP